MARGPSQTLLTSQTPTAIVPAEVNIGHVQLRDLIICPRERGVVNYVRYQSVVEQNLNAPDSTPRILADLSFTPNTLTSLPIEDYTLLASGGQEAEIHLSLHNRNTPSSYSSSSHPRSRSLWQFEASLPGSINNSVLLTSLSLTRSHESSVEPRVAISNNDCTVKFYDVPIRGHHAPKSIKEAGALRLDVPVNHSSISPDGRTLLSVGDSPKVYLHRLTGGARISFTPITTLAIPPPDVSPLNYSSSSLAASFSTAFSSNGTKFAVASQEGVVVVWDVRSSKPLKVFQTDKTRLPPAKGSGNGSASGWLSDDPWEWTRGNSKAPGWSVRSVKFGNGGEGGNSGKELMSFTEHTSLLHIVDARTFETEEIIRVPAPHHGPRPTTMTVPVRHTPRPRPRSISPRYVMNPNPMPSLMSRQPAATSMPTAPLIVLALEDTFRIPSSSHSPSRRGHLTVNSGHNEEDIVVIPSMGDPRIEEDVQALLGRHGIRARQHSELRYPYSGERNTNEDEMEVDELELESDCFPSRTPSRSSSPSPSTRVASGSPGASRPVSVPTPVRSFTRRSTGRQLDAPQEEEEDDSHDMIIDNADAELESDLDLAGTCFDPSGGYVYVASTEGIAEWSVRGAEKRWWFDDSWV